MAMTDGVLSGFVWVQLHTDHFVIGVPIATMALIAVGEYCFLKRSRKVGSFDADD